MTVQISIPVLILIVVIVLAAFLLPMIWQMKKSAQEADKFLQELRRDLLPAIRDIGEIADRVNRASAKIEKGGGKIEEFFESLGETTDSLHQLGKIFRQDLGAVVQHAACLILGLKAAGRVIFKDNQDKGG